MPDEYTAHSQLASRMEAMGTHTYFATGEHEYTRWGYKQLLDAGVGLLQPDVSFRLPPAWTGGSAKVCLSTHSFLQVMWMGGPTEFVKVVALASAYGTPVVPHGCGVYGYFMAMAFNECPLCEFMMMSEQADRIEPNFGEAFHLSCFQRIVQR